MLIQTQPPVHLTYCLNIHPGETWPENFASIRTQAAAVRDAVNPPGPFGLGLRLSRQAAIELSPDRAQEDFRRYLAEAGMYVFTVNGFPYGQFHGTRVKERVYEPDWRSELRRDYTVQLADILAGLLPPGGEGSISTVPLGYKPAWSSATDEPQARQRLLETVRHLHRLHETTGRLVHLGLEPEPDCVLETTDEAIGFFQRLWPVGERWLRGQVPSGQEEAILRRHLGVCFDTCHVALQFEDSTAMLRRFVREAIRLSKIQISAALETQPASAEAIRAFDEPVYLHQVKAWRPGGKIEGWRDLPEALQAWPADAGKIRIHFHVPLFWEGTPEIRPTSNTLTPEFWTLVKSGICPHLEVETYSFGMMPAAVRPPGVVRSLECELNWVRRQWNNANSAQR